VGAADVVRYVASARATLRGPLVLELEGPGDPLASAENMLRALALVHEHHPDVITGLVIDGPLLGEYTEELRDLGLNYVTLRMDAATEATAQRIVDGAVYKGELLGREDAARLMIDGLQRALFVAQKAGLPVAIRTTIIPTINMAEFAAIARMAARGGAQRIDVMPHQPVPGAPLARAGIPTSEELAEARDHAAIALHAVADLDMEGMYSLDWLDPRRFQTVDREGLEAVDIRRILPDPFDNVPQGQVLPRRRAQLVAVATRDGTLVDHPLKGTDRLLVYAVTSDQIKLLGARHLPKDKRRKLDGVGDARRFLEALAGCRALVTTGFSARAITLLQAVGMRAIATDGAVDVILDRVARGTIPPAQ
jgi:hypothetical protein